MPDLLGDDVGAGRIGLGQEDDELVAAVAGGRVDAPDAGRDDVADAAQDAVAVEVAVPVVDGLELVEVHHQQAEPARGAGAPGDLALEGGEEEAAVEQAGQRIDGRQADGRVTRPTLLAGDDHRGVRQQDERAVRLMPTVAAAADALMPGGEPSTTART